MNVIITDSTTIPTNEVIFKGLFIDKCLSINFAECVGKDSNKIFFGFDFESFDHTLYASYVEKDNEDNEEFYEIDLSIFNDKAVMLKDLKDAVHFLCNSIDANIYEMMFNVGESILTSDLMDVYRCYCDMIKKITKIYKCTDDNVLIAVCEDSNYARVINPKDNTIDYLYDLFMACMDKHPSFALKCFFEKNKI